MKQTLIIGTFLFLILACNSNGDTDKSEGVDTAQNVAPEDPDVTKGLQLVGKSDCFTCHKVVDQHTGPAYKAVAAKYPNNNMVIDSLAQKIKKGGVGNWGTIPMTPHPDLSLEDAKLMVKYVLSLK